MGALASQNTSLKIVYSTVYSDADQRKHQSFASLAFVRGSHRRQVNSPHKWPVTRKMFSFDDVIMKISFAHDISPSCLIVLKFCTERGSDTTLQNFKTIRQRTWMIWKKQIWRDFSLRGISIEYSYCSVTNDAYYTVVLEIYMIWSLLHQSLHSQ